MSGRWTGIYTALDIWSTVGGGQGRSAKERTLDTSVTGGTAQTKKKRGKRSCRKKKRMGGGVGEIQTT